MPAVYIENVGAHEGNEITLRGWVYNKRSSGKLQFILLRDGTGVIQCVAFKGNFTPEQFDALDKLTQESSIEIRGKVRKDSRSPGGYELDVTGFEIVQVAENYPITPKEHGTAFLMENRHLWLRSSRQHAIIKIRHEVIKACRDYFDDLGFTLVDTPIFTPNACEGTTTLFETRVFRSEGISDSKRTALQRSNRGGLRKSLLFRADVPGGEIQNPQAPDGILDGRAGGCLCEPRRHDAACRRADLLHPRAGSDAAQSSTGSAGAQYFASWRRSPGLSHG